MKNTWLFFIVFFFSPVFASPTSYDFLPCHKLASSMLLYCLDEKPGYVNDDCFDKARLGKDACYLGVSEKYTQPDDNRIKAEKEAIKKIQ
jgi:hypothetical protein